MPATDRRRPMGAARSPPLRLFMRPQEVRPGGTPPRCPHSPSGQPQNTNRGPGLAGTVAANLAAPLPGPFLRTCGGGPPGPPRLRQRITDVRASGSKSLASPRGEVGMIQTRIRVPAATGDDPGTSSKGSFVIWTPKWAISHTELQREPAWQRSPEIEAPRSGPESPRGVN